MLGAAAPVLASCGSTGAGLIPARQAGPLRSDFDAVAQAAEQGNGSCAPTEEAILKTESDFSALPGSVDSGLRRRIREGITALRADALDICKQPLAGTTTGTTPKTTGTSTETTTTPTVTHTNSTPTQTSTTNTTTTGAGGGTPAPGSGGEGSSGAGSEQGGSGGAPGGTSGPTGGSGPGTGGQEGGR